MGADLRRSARITSKPAPKYKETMDRKPKGTRDDPEDIPTPISAERGKDDHSPSKPVDVEDQHRRINKRKATHLMDVSSNLGVSFPECLRSRYGEDPFFAPILRSPSEFTNFREEEGLVYFKSEDVETLAIPDIKVDGQDIRELLIRQGHSILAHLSSEKMATYLRDQVWWKTMIKDIEEYCKTCHTCTISKPQGGKPQGKLKMMPVPTQPWQYVGIDFVGPLPESSN